MSDEPAQHGEPASSDGEQAGAEPIREPGRKRNREPDGEIGPVSGGDTSLASGGGTERDGHSTMDLDSMGEDALRQLLRDSVRDIEPSPDALEHLRQAVPARRAQRRRAVMGTAAAVLACSVAVPAMLHADFGPDDDKPMHAAGHAHDRVAEQEKATGGDQGEGPGAGDGWYGGSVGTADQGAQAGPPTTGSSAGPDPSSSLGPLSPSCTREQLGGAKGVHGEPDAKGRVYGSFTVVNTSETSCTVEGDGIVFATAQGSAKSTMIQVIDHTTGDEATGLPDPVTAADEVVLEPHAAYMVKFAWVPREGGGTSGCSTSSPPPGGESGGTETSGGQKPMGSSDSLGDGSATGGSETGGTGTEDGDGTDTGSGGGEGGASGGAGATGGTGSTGGEGDTAPPASVVISHTPDVGGEPVPADVVLEGACAGTVYRTGALPTA